MKRISGYIPIVMLAVQAVFPAAKLVFALCGWNIAPANGCAYAAFLAAVSIAGVALMAKREQRQWEMACVSIALPLSLVNLILLPGLGDAIMICVAAVNSVVCLLAFSYGRGLRLLRVFMGILSGMLAMAAAAVMFMVIVMDDFGMNTVVRELPSDDGRYVAQVIDSDQGALGGSTVVRVKRTRLLGVSVENIVKLDRRVWMGDWGLAHEVGVMWEDADTLVVNGIEYDF